ncbi:MAG: 50S ribosomal protein L19e [archaeon GB-1867-005]|nr:50S ribosomal protein L19e [Candidatus Culexmicrobium cathedralense]
MPLTLRTVRRLAADILGVGENRVWIDPENLDKVAEAMTREDVKILIRQGLIKARPEKSISRARIRMKREKKKRGRRRGPGSRKGPTIRRKELWMIKVRAQRKFLKMLRKRRIINRTVYRKLYMMVKGGAFDSTSQIKTYIREHGLARRR